MSERHRIEDAQARLPELIERAAAGEEVLIGHPDGPLVVLRRYDLPKERRPLGSLRGRIRLAEDFDAPSPALMRQMGLEH